jgi:HAD superfamily hydrolase (TIGR01509 family)
MGILVALSGTPEWTTVSDLIERHERAAVRDSVPMPGLAAMLSASSRLPRAVVTLLPETTARSVLDAHGIRLEVLVGRRSDLAPKPAPDQLLEACRLLGVHHADALMIGDSTWDMEAARTAGCGFTGLTNGRRSEFPPGTDVVTDLFAVAERIQ